ncbi:MAG: SRPBCC family protein, partial [Thermoanaerobaculia bacterium]
MTPRFHMNSLLSADPSAAYRWHARPGAFERLVPPWQSIRVLERSGQGVDEGVQITLRLDRGPFHLDWRAQHGPAEPGRRFEDYQVSGPFKSWHHVHEFLPGGG